jgi:hypothetical protein
MGVHVWLPNGLRYGRGYFRVTFAGDLTSAGNNERLAADSNPVPCTHCSAAFKFSGDDFDKILILFKTIIDRAVTIRCDIVEQSQLAHLNIILAVQQIAFKFTCWDFFYINHVSFFLGKPPNGLRNPQERERKTIMLFKTC